MGFDPIASIFTACIPLLPGNWFEDRFLEAEGTDIDPVLRPFDGPEDPLVGATKVSKLRQHPTA